MSTKQPSGHGTDRIRYESFTADEIVPIPAKCPKCKFDWVGRDAIRAPSLRNVGCFWCGARQLKPHPDYPPVVDALTRRHQRGTFIQASFEITAMVAERSEG